MLCIEINQVLFASDVWHRSAPNTTAHERRVFYAQYSDGAVTAGPAGKYGSGNNSGSEEPPLNFAVKTVCSRDLGEP